MNRAMPARAPRPSRSAGWLVLVVLLAVAAWFLLICGRILQQGRKDEVHPAAAIIVFGAAEYDGRPSPVYRARLDHGYELFARRIAPMVITTGGYGLDPNFSEGGVGRDYLASRGVPAANLIAETQGADTAQSARRVAVIMRANSLRDCVAVSDAYHVFRVKMMLRREGITAYTSPRPDSRPHTLWQRIVAIAREAASYALWLAHIT
jgi:uncharacterized SAM-binding protein YcdF (DUF218 family)